MTKIRRARLPESEWEKHKSIIKKLYLDEKKTLEGDHGVMTYMQTRYELHASKAQYETRFKKWGFRKNLKKDEWQIIGNVIQRRHDMGLSSRVYLYGERISSEKVQKETTRYRTDVPMVTSLEGEVLPEGVSISSSPRVATPSTSSGETEGSPDIDTFPNSSPSRSLTRTPVSMANDYFASIEASTMDMSLVPSRIPTPSMDLDTEFLTVLSDIDCQEVVRIMELPDSTVISHPIIDSIPLNTLTLFRNLRNPLLQESRGLGNQLSRLVDPCIGRTMPLLPARAQKELQSKSLDVVFFRQIMFLLMNNFAGSDYAAFEALFQQLQHFSIPQMEQLLDAIPAPYAAALQQSILTIAIKAGIASIVKILLKRGVEPDRVLCRFAGALYTPLGLACKFRHLEIVRILIGSGVNVNGKHGHSWHTAIWHLLGFEYGKSRYEEDLSPITCKILALLLRAGAKMQWFELENSRFWDDEAMLEVYLSYSTSSLTFYHSFEIQRPLMNATRLSDNDRSARAVKVMLGNDFKVDKYLDAEIKYRCQEALQRAAYRGNESLVDFFLRAGLQPTERCLTEAVRGDSVAVVHQLIQEGMNWDCVISPDHSDNSDILRPFAGILPDDIDPFLREESLIRHGWTTPFAEAIRWRHGRLIRLFQELGVLSRITEVGRFIAALIAASEASNEEMVEYLLERAKNTTVVLVPALSVCISLATLAGHEGIVNLLMNAGVRPEPPSLTAAILVRNATLLRIFLDAATPVEMPGLLFFAVRWGNREVIEQLIEAGATVNESGFGLGFMEINSLARHPPLASPLGEAIRIGNQQTIELLLYHGADITKESRIAFSGSKGLSPLAVAVQAGNEYLVTDLLSRGADPNDPVALLAATSQSISMLQILIDHFKQCYPNGRKYFASKALRRAIRAGNIDQTKLLAPFTDLNDKEQRREEPDEVEQRIGQYDEFLPTPLGEAIASGNVEIVHILLQEGGDPNSTVATKVRYPHAGRWTALLQAIHSGSLEIVQLLCAWGAKIHCDATLGLNRTPLQCAVELGHYEIIQYLLECGADVNAKPALWAGATALQRAAAKGYVGIAEILIQRGADVNAPRGKFQWRRTAFEEAAEHGRMDMLLLLYHNGVDLVSDGGEQVRRAMDFAERNGQLAAKSLVEQLSQLAAMNSLMVI